MIHLHKLQLVKSTLIHLYALQLVKFTLIHLHTTTGQIHIDPRVYIRESALQSNHVDLPVCITIGQIPICIATGQIPICITTGQIPICITTGQIYALEKTPFNQH